MSEFYNPDTVRTTGAAVDSHFPVYGIKCITATFTRPANTTYYAIADSVNSSTSSPTAMTFEDITRASTSSATIVGARLYTSQVGCTASFRLHLYTASPTLVNDNAAFTVLWANHTNRIGHIDFPACKSSGTGSTMAYSQAIVSIPFCAAASTSIYGVLETLTVFTPASGQGFAITLMVDRS